MLVSLAIYLDDYYVFFRQCPVPRHGELSTSVISLAKLSPSAATFPNFLGATQTSYYFATNRAYIEKQ